MKKFLVLSVLFGIMLAVVGCGSNPIKEDIDTYLEEIKKIASKEESVIKAYEAVSGTNYTDDETLYNGIDENVILQYREFSDLLGKIEPKTSELREVHEIYIEATNAQMKAFNQVMQALEEQDRELVNKANDNFNTAAKLIRDYKFAFTELAAKNGFEKINE